MQGHPVVTLDQAEEILDAPLVDVDGIDVAEVVAEELLDPLRILLQLVSDRGAARRNLRDLLGLLLFELGLECRHVATHLVRTVDPAGGSARRHLVVPHDPTLTLWSRSAGLRRCRAMMTAMDISTRAEFAAPVETVFAMMTDQAYLEEVCRASQAINYEASVAGSTTQTSRRLPSPEAAARFTGPELTVVEEITWEEPRETARGPEPWS